ncbi:MAG: putative 2-aminoethylphosphonate ABC transporter substrate-binding protein [Geminicoccaceae bacterium]
MTSNPSRHPFHWLAIAALGGLGTAAAPAHAQTKLLVYTAVEADELKMFEEAAEKAILDLDIEWVRDSTGIVTAKLIAEKDNPQAEMVWGLAATSLLLLADMDYFQPYAPKGVDQLSPKFVDKQDPPRWVGQRAYAAALCYNTIEGERQGVPQPSSWADLTKPVYQGHVVMPNPASSGTGFLNVSAWLQMWGEEKAWQYMDGLHQNIFVYTHSGSKPCHMAATGEAVVGISFAYRAADLKTEGAPIAAIAPDEGVGWEEEAMAIVATTKGDKLEAAKKLADWSVSKDAMELYNKGMAVVAMPGVAKPPENFPPNIEEKMVDNDFSWAAAHRDEILKEWQSRYGVKSEPKG